MRVLSRRDGRDISTALAHICGLLDGFSSTKASSGANGLPTAYDASQGGFDRPWRAIEDRERKALPTDICVQSRNIARNPILTEQCSHVNEPHDRVYAMNLH